MILVFEVKKPRHTGGGRYPDKLKSPTQVGLHHGFACFAECFIRLDTGLRRYDGPTFNRG
jgi:hypothetical protein